MYALCCFGFKGVISTIYIIAGYCVDLCVVLMEQMILSVLYVWCQINRDEIIEFWLGTRFKAMCLPWIYVAFDIIVDHRSPVIALSGVIVGHVYFFLMFKYPLDFGGVRLLYAPRILYKNFPNRREKMAWFGQAPASLRRSSDDQDEHRWGGRGHILGGN